MRKVYRVTDVIAEVVKDMAAWKPLTRRQLGEMNLDQMLTFRYRLNNIAARLAIEGIFLTSPYCMQAFMDLQRQVVIAQAEEGTRKSCAKLIDSLP